MDGDRFRAPERRVVNGSSRGGNAPSSYRQTEELPRQQEVLETPRPAKNSRQERGVPTKKRLGWLWVLLSILGVALIIGGWVIWTQAEKNETGIDKSKYQAIFLSNGQHYFGKLERMNDEYFKLTDVYYLESKNTADADSDTSSRQTEVELRKLGETEIHGPEDTMIISKQQVLMYENLKDKSQVVTSIDQHKQQAK